jgi:hypothetical protein
MLSDTRAAELHELARALEQPFSRAQFALATLGHGEGRVLCGVGTVLRRLQDRGLVQRIASDKYIATEHDEQHDEHEPLRANPTELSQTGAPAWPPPPPFPVAAATYERGYFWVWSLDRRPHFHDGVCWRPA